VAESTLPHRTADIADALREGISRGYLGVRDAIEWARGEVLAERPRPPDPLVSHLARSGHRPASNILLILTQLAWGADARRVGHISAQHLRNVLLAGRIDPRGAAHAIYRLYRDGYAPDSEFERAAQRFDEEVEHAQRADAVPPDLGSRITAFLDRYSGDPDPSGDEREPATGPRDQLALAAEGATSETIELSARVAWRWWTGHVRLTVNRERLSAFASDLRDFSTHHASGAKLDEGEGGDRARLALAATEYGRARRAAVELHLRDAEAGWPPAELRLWLPTEHELVGDFAADIAEMVATGAGVAQLRLLSRWAGDRQS
jgi:hypothetical protein